MTREEIDDKVCELMIKYGPDGHVDGHDRITDFIMELLQGSFTKEEMRQAYDDGMANIDCDGCEIDPTDIDFEDTITQILNERP